MKKYFCHDPGHTVECPQKNFCSDIKMNDTTILPRKESSAKHKILQIIKTLSRSYTYN